MALAILESAAGRCKFHGGRSTGPKTEKVRTRALADVRQNRWPVRQLAADAIPVHNPKAEPHDALARKRAGPVTSIPAHAAGPGCMHTSPRPPNAAAASG